MINVKEMPISKEDIVNIQMWARGYRENHDISWPQFSAECGVPAGTLGPFVQGKYGAKDGGSNIARQIYQFRQAVEARSKRKEKLPEDPGFFETKTSRRLQHLLTEAHDGKIVIAATGPGTGKTISIDDYIQKAQPAYKATMRPSTARLLPMILEVHKALGIPSTGRMPSAVASQMVVERLKKRGALLIIDEANYLETESLEEIRSWFDECLNLGIALFGNEELLIRIKSGKHRDQFRRLSRRVGGSTIQQVPFEEDVAAFCDAWGIEAHDIRQFLKTVALSRDAGGLGECQQLVEAASILAASEGRGLTIGDLRDVKASRATRYIDA